MKKLLLLALLPFSVKAQLNITFQSQLDYAALGLHGTTALSNLWGYADELGNEYAIVGANNGVSIVDVTDPTTPVEVFFTGGLNSIWREIKTYNNYAYITTEASEGMTIIDLNPLPGAITSANVSIFNGPVGNPWISAHSLFIDENGILFLHGTNRGNGGVILYDLNTSPTNPTEVGVFDPWYVHDSYARGDTLYSAHINDGFFTVTDVSTPASITLLSGEQNTPKNFTHNCWLSQDGNFLFTTDEVSGAWIGAYDISDLGNIKEVDRIRRSETSGTIPHNTYWLNNYLVTSYYRDGVTIHDVTDPSNMIEVGNFDTSPMSGDGFNGAWGVYAFLPSGNLLISDIEEGLFVLSPTYTRACYLDGNVTDASTTNNLANVHVEVVTTANFDNSDLAGMYSTGVAVAGSYDVIYSKAGYISDTFTVNLVSATTVTQDVALVPLPTFNFTGSVLTATSLTPIPGAQVIVYNDAYSYTTTADGSGNFSVGPMSLDTANNEYNISIGLWGYHTFCMDNVLLDGTQPPLTALLAPGFYDDFMMDFGWSVSSTASTGHWIREAPIASFSGITLSNPNADIATDCRDKAYVTGNTDDFSASTDDVDNGNTELTSPVFNTTGVTDAWISVYAWFANSGGTGTPNDTLILSLYNGATQHVLAKYHINNFPLHTWKQRTFKVSDYTAATTNLTLKLTVTDYTPGHVLDAGLDLFEITSGNPLAGIDDVPVMSSTGLLVYPNPAQSTITIRHVDVLESVQVIDMTGKMVLNKTVNDRVSTIDLSSLGQGVYSIRTVDLNGKTASARIVKQ